MISLDLSRLPQVHRKHGLSVKELQKQYKQIDPFLQSIEKKNQGFYKVIDDESVVAEIEAYAAAQAGKWNDIVVLGIGGSALGTICLQETLTHLYKKGTPQLHVLDNIDPIMMQEILDVISLEKTLVVVVSKSGTTPEVLSQFLYMQQMFEEKQLPLSEHFVFVTDPEKGFLVDVAKERGVTTFSIPPSVGGRFSVQTPVGLLPAALIGIDIRALLAGAREMRDLFLSTRGEENLPFQIATIQFLLYNKGKVMNVMMPYAQKLTRFADWYRQLLAESIGKAANMAGKKVNVGITPIKALGATDQHSQSQLYNEGPHDKFFFFLRVKNFGTTVDIPSLYDDERTTFLKGASFNELIDTELQATAQSYTNNDRPNVTVEVETVDAHHLGQLFLLFEGATAFLGEYFQINAFDQPGVEEAKILTKEFLSQKHGA